MLLKQKNLSSLQFSFPQPNIIYVDEDLARRFWGHNITVKVSRNYEMNAIDTNIDNIEIEIESSFYELLGQLAKKLFTELANQNSRPTSSQISILSVLRLEEQNLKPSISIWKESLLNLIEAHKAGNLSNMRKYHFEDLEEIRDELIE